MLTNSSTMCLSEAVEEWRVVPSDPSLEASSFGRIRVIPWKHSNGKTYGGRPTFGQWADGRFIYCRRGHKTRKVHHLVAEAFIGPRPNGLVCMHDDENAANNRPGNLVYGTQKENLNYPGFIEYCKSRTGENNPHIKGKK